MKRLSITIPAAIALALCCAGCAQSTKTSATSSPSLAATASSNACVFPTEEAATGEETAWRLFIAANCKANQTQLVWETWVEQNQLYHAGSPSQAAGAKPPRLHGSPLAAIERARHEKRPALLVPSTGCEPMRSPPPNLAATTICEEVHINPNAAAFITSNSYDRRVGQKAAAQKGSDIEFPAPAIEVKVDWVPASDFSQPFSCTQPPNDLHVEVIDGTCYALVGMHVISKLTKNWIWATFEPQSLLTNPLRCKTFGPCNDSWGSVPATSNGGSQGLTKQSTALATLMQSADIGGEFASYRLDGVQTLFLDSGNRPTLLGNSIIEGEHVGLKTGESSCITCHSYSSIKTDGTDGVALLPDGPTGTQHIASPGWVLRDFVWSMLLAH
jgi:hypothetical protein